VLNSHYTSLVVRYARLTNALALLGQRMSMASSAMLVTGALPSPELIDSLRTTREAFSQVRAEIFDLVRGAGITPAKALEEVVSLRDLTDLLEGLEAAHAQSLALAVLDRVALLQHVDLINEFEPLREAHQRARVLKTAIEAGGLADRHADVAVLADGRHPFAQLLELVESSQSLDDERWRLLEATVAEAFGRVLAAAAARAKLQILGCGVATPLAVLDALEVELPAAEIKVEAEEVQGLVIEHAWAARTQPAEVESGALPLSSAVVHSDSGMDMAVSDFDGGQPCATPADEAQGVSERQMGEADAAQALSDPAGEPHAGGAGEPDVDDPQVGTLQLAEAELAEPVTLANRGWRLARRAKRLADLAVRSVLVVVILAVAAVGTPLLFGWQFYAVDGGSMEPAIALGSVVAVQPVSLSQLRVGDIITFADRSEPDTRVTHRVVGVDSRGGRQVVRTRGDANELEDAVPVEGDQFVGRVASYLPYVGSVADSLSGPYTLFALACSLGVLLVSQVLGRGKRLRE
jgi:signal peptidase I